MSRYERTVKDKSFFI